MKYYLYPRPWKVQFDNPYQLCMIPYLFSYSIYTALSTIYLYTP